jgi:hypothetical protein
MKKLFAAIMLLGAAQAFAHCPDLVTCEMKAIDTSLATSTASEALLEKVKGLRAEGKKLYDEGREREAMKVLKEARKMLKEGAAS